MVKKLNLALTSVIALSMYSCEPVFEDRCYNVQLTENGVSGDAPITCPLDGGLQTIMQECDYIGEHEDSSFGHTIKKWDCCGYDINGNLDQNLISLCPPKDGNLADASIPMGYEGYCGAGAP